MANKPYVGDIGTEILVDIGTDISTASTHELIVKKPDGTEVTWDAVINGTNSLKYIILDGDFDKTGRYTIQSHIIITDVGEWFGETTYFQVYGEYE